MKVQTLIKIPSRSASSLVNELVSGIREGQINTHEISESWKEIGQSGNLDLVREIIRETHKASGKRGEVVRKEKYLDTFYGLLESQNVLSTFKYYRDLLSGKVTKRKEVIDYILREQVKTLQILFDMTVETKMGLYVKKAIDSNLFFESDLIEAFLIHYHRKPRIFRTILKKTRFDPILFAEKVITIDNHHRPAEKRMFVNGIHILHDLRFSYKGTDREFMEAQIPELTDEQQRWFDFVTRMP